MDNREKVFLLQKLQEAYDNLEIAYDLLSDVIDIVDEIEILGDSDES